MESVKNVLTKYRPDIFINTAAYVRVDDCEDHKDEAYLVNALGARNVAVACEDAKTRLLHISTDYVFGGEERRQNIPFTEFDNPVPINSYGKSKLAGEEMVKHLCHRYFIVRVSGLFGVAGSSGKGGNFIETILRLAKTRPELRVVNDQVFSPTSTKDLAVKIAELINTDYYGIFHVTNRGNCSWFEFTQEILRLTGNNTPVYPITSAEYPQKAKRPSYSVLDNYQLRLLGMDNQRSWNDALNDYLRSKGYSE
jgi:dTDP-4-dehydrorhamnose reductase